MPRNEPARGTPESATIRAGRRLMDALRKAAGTSTSGLRAGPGTSTCVVEQLEYRPWPLTAIRQLAGCLVRGQRVPGRTTAQQLTHVGGAGADVVTGEPLRERGGE